jgi:two-component system nitrate/nitrite response regulator NarL
MRVVICDDHVVFAESISHLLAMRGMEIAAITHHPMDAASVLRRESVDVCLMDVMFGTISALAFLPDLRAAAPRTGVVLLTAWLDAPLLANARAAGVHGIANKCQPADEIFELIERVSIGDIVIPDDRELEPARASGRRLTNHVQQMASYLTPRERQILSGLVRGAGTTKLASGMGITEVTARCHIQNVLTKLGAHSRLEAAFVAVRNGLIDPATGEWLIPA